MNGMMGSMTDESSIQGESFDDGPSKGTPALPASPTHL